LLFARAFAGTSPLRLPDDATPVRESVRLWLDPRVESFHGEADLTVALHGARRSLH
jgi:hypothetical protein